MEVGHLCAVHAVARRVEISKACLLDGEKNEYGYRGASDARLYPILDGIQPRYSP